MKIIQDLALWYLARVKRDKRANGEEFIYFEASEPENEQRCRDMARHAHNNGEILPDDWRYQFIVEALNAISDCENPDDVNMEPDIYTSELTGWLNSRTDRYGYCDQAIENGLVSCQDQAYGKRNQDTNFTIQLLSAGQYEEKQEVLAQVLNYLRNELEEMEQE